VKILLALLAIALAAVLVVSATMGAGTLVPGGDSGKKKPRGVVLGGTAGKPRLLPLGLSPLVVKGTGFEPGESVTVKVADGLARATKTVRADAAGSFVARTGAAGDRCNGMTVLAVGNKGSKTSFNFAEALCAASGAQG
jgi:hypothetical protein